MNTSENSMNEVLMKLVESSGRVEAKLEHIEKTMVSQREDSIRLEERVKNLENKENKRAGIIIVVVFLITMAGPYLKELILK